MQIIKYNNLSWINISFPAEKDITYLRDNFHFHELVLEELLTPTFHPKVDDFGSYLYFVIHIPIYVREKRKNVNKEIDIIVAKNVLVTVLYDDALEPFDKLFRQCQLEEAACERYFGGNIGHLLYYIIDGLLQALLPPLKHMEQNIESIEEEIFSQAATLVEEISIIRRDILDFRRTIRPQLLVLQSLASKSDTFFGKELRHYFDDLIGDYNRVWDLLENYKDTIDSLHDTHNSMLSYRLNNVMKVLTIFAVAAIPFTVVPQIFSVKTAYVPFQDSPYGFWILLGIMALGIAIILVVLKRKRWL